MSTALLASLGIASAVVNTAATIPYIRDIFRHKTKPERATFWIWLMLDIIAISAQAAAGATWSLFMTGAQTLAIGAIAILSVKYGYGRFRRKDFISILIAVAGIVLWFFTKQPISALLIVIVIDILALWLTAAKTWIAPYTETLISWVLATITGVLGALSVGQLNFTRLIYPIYITLGDGLVMVLIIYRRKQVKEA